MDLLAAEAVLFGVYDRAAAALWNGAIKSLEEADFLEKSGAGPIAQSLSVKSQRLCGKKAKKK